MNPFLALCPSAVTVSELAAACAEARASFGSEGADAQLERIVGGLPCVTEPLAPELAADVHFALATLAYLRRAADPIAAPAQWTGHLCAARALRPAFDAAGWLGSPGHPLARLPSCDDATLAAQVPGLSVDGRPAESVPASRPFVAQLPTAEGLRTVLVSPSEAEAFVAAALPPPAAGPVAEPAPPPAGAARSWRGPVAWTGTAFGVGSAALLGAAGVVKLRYDEDPTRARYVQNLAFASSGIALGAVSTGLLGAALAGGRAGRDAP